MIGRRTMVMLWVAVLVSAGACSGDGSDQADSGTELTTATTGVTATATGKSENPPCFGLDQVGELPDWARPVDFTLVVGCEFEGGVLLVNEELGRAIAAYVTDCESFGSTDIEAELRPTAGEPWVCHQPGESGTGEMIVPREG